MRFSISKKSSKSDVEWTLQDRCLSAVASGRLSTHHVSDGTGKDRVLVKTKSIKAGKLTVAFESWPKSQPRKIATDAAMEVVSKFTLRLEPKCPERAGALIIARDGIELSRRARLKSPEGKFVINLNAETTRHSESDLRAFLIRRSYVQDDLALLVDAATGVDGIDTEHLIKSVTNAASGAALGFI